MTCTVATVATDITQQNYFQLSKSNLFPSLPGELLAVPFLPIPPL